ncbi:MAG: PH domain-containing protein, partial [Synergistaceae bacterium]|nr:PH domain-containing protein [Synergistaceae bacterium]
MEQVRIEYRTAWRSFYGLFSLMILILILAIAANIWGPDVLKNHVSWMWILVAIVELVIFLGIALKRFTMKLVLKDDPDRPENQEIEYVECHPLKFFTKFRISKEIGLTKIADIDVSQNAIQTILNIGDIAISSPGTSEKEVKACNIPDPRAVRDEIQKH